MNASQTKMCANNNTINHIAEEMICRLIVFGFLSVFRFMDNLQTEVLEIEFLTYSKGMTTISEEDFAKILLRFTNVENISAYLENVRQCIPDEKVKYARTHFFTGQFIDQ